MSEFKVNCDKCNTTDIYGFADIETTMNTPSEYVDYVYCRKCGTTISVEGS